MTEQWLNVNSFEQWLLTTVVDRVQHNIVEQCAAQQVVDNIDQVVQFCVCSLNSLSSPCLTVECLERYFPKLGSIKQHHLL